MKSLILSLMVVASQLSFGGSVSGVDTILNVLNKVYLEAPEAFGGAKVGVESGYTNCSISQEHMIDELERDLEFQPGLCEYKNEVGLKENIKLIENVFSSRAARIIRKLRNDGHIDHISSRTLSFQNMNMEEDCLKQHFSIVLKNGSLIWIDFN